MSERSTVLLEHHLKELKLPTFLREYGKVAGQCAAEGVDHPGYLLRLSELELIDRHHRMVERRIKAARFPATKSLDTFDFLAMPSVNKHLAMQLARCEYVDRRENVIAIGNSGTGKTHVALGLGTRRLPEGAVGRLHHRNLAGPRADRGQGRAATAQPPEEDLPDSSCSSSTNLASYHSPRPARSSSSRSSASATREGRSWSQPTCPSTSGPRSSAPRG